MPLLTAAALLAAAAEVVTILVEEVKGVGPLVLLLLLEGTCKISPFSIRYRGVSTVWSWPLLLPQTYRQTDEQTGRERGRGDGR